MKRLYLCLYALLFATVATAAEAPSADVRPSADIRSVIAKKFPGVSAEDVRPSLIRGVYEVTMGGDMAYVSADGRYAIAGDLYDIDTRQNLTEAGRTSLRVKTLAKLDERDMIIFKPAVVKHTITVFTDVDCGYCRKLHSEIDALNKLGIQVRYLAYPRAGPETKDWQKMEAVWCSKDRRAAITDAKRGKDVNTQPCGATPVAAQYALGERLGVRGTPAIFTTGGDYIGGYLQPAQMFEQLEALSRQGQSEAKSASSH